MAQGTYQGLSSPKIEIYSLKAAWLYSYFLTTANLMQITKPSQTIGDSIVVGVFATHLERYMNNFVAIVFVIGL